MTSSKQSCTFIMVSCPLKFFSLDTSHGILWNLMGSHGRVSTSEPGCAVDRAPVVAYSRRSHVAFRSPPSRVAQWAPPGAGEPGSRRLDIGGDDPAAPPPITTGATPGGGPPQARRTAHPIFPAAPRPPTAR